MQQKIVYAGKEFTRQEGITLGIIRKTINGNAVSSISQTDERTGFEVKRDRTYLAVIKTIDFQFLDTGENQGGTFIAIPNFTELQTLHNCNTLLFLSTINGNDQIKNNLIGAPQITAVNTLVTTTVAGSVRQIEYTTPKSHTHLFRNSLTFTDSAAATVTGAYTIPVSQASWTSTPNRSELIPANSRFTRLDTAYMISGVKGFIVPNFTTRNLEDLTNISLTTGRFAGGFDPFNSFIGSAASGGAGDFTEFTIKVKFHIDIYEGYFQAGQ